MSLWIVSFLCLMLSLLACLFVCFCLFLLQTKEKRYLEQAAALPHGGHSRPLLLFSPIPCFILVETAEAFTEAKPLLLVTNHRYNVCCHLYTNSYYTLLMRYCFTSMVNTVSKTFTKMKR